MTRFDIISEEAFDIIYNTYRMKIINAFGSRDHMTATFKQIADQLGDNSSKVTYHGKMLIKIDLLVLDHTENINGIVAKYYRLVSDNFRIRFGDKKNELIRAKILKSQVDIANDSLHQMSDLVNKNDSESRSIAFAMNDLHLTKEEMTELWGVIEKFNEKKERKDHTNKVTFYTLIVSEHGDKCSDDSSPTEENKE